MELRMRWTMQVCTIVGGNTAAITSGNPFRPSTTAIRMSSTPRFLSSVMTRNQNLAPSEVSIQRPRMSFVPSALRRARHRRPCCGADPRHGFDRGASRKPADTSVPAAGSPSGHRLQNGVRHRRNDGRDLQAIKLQQMALDLANGHAARIHRHDLLVEARKPALMARDQLWIEHTLPVTRNAQIELRGLGQHRLLRIALRLLRFPAAAFAARWSSISAFRTRSAKAFFDSSSSPSLAKTASGPAPPANCPGCLS